MCIEIWYIKPDVIDDIVEYIKFYHQKNMTVEKIVNGRNHMIKVILKKSYIKESKKEGFDRKELLKQTEDYIERVVLRFECDKDETYATNLKFSRHMKLKQLMKW